MKRVMEYQNYRLYVRDFYTERKIRSGFTWRDFAKAAGYSSPVFLKLVCDGKTNLSDVGIERVANAMGLVGADLQYFRALVNFNQEKDSSKKKEVFKELRAIAKENEMTLVGEDQYDYYESWINPVLRELAPQVPEATPAQVADMLAFDTQAAEVKKALKLLEKVGLLNKDSKGRFEQSSKAITTGNIEVTSLSVREMHRQMGELAVRSLDEVPVNERDISGLTVGISEDAYGRIAKEIEDFRRRVASIVMQDTDEDRVYRLNIQLFPLTKKFKGRGNNA
ncbi:MAG: TIGR02147 family protein [Fibrobacter sp.]|uniref:TIGR02147 family protein n=1 Tax=Fibrobacter sp. TaxID=35828 RepID=UPI0025BB40F9|nr:TIGR02147 family protein [Fibrobacter sp.]MBR4783814.1 TIGR02147 family protein [Fibrobacter sp.]